MEGFLSMLVEEGGLPMIFLTLKTNPTLTPSPLRISTSLPGGWGRIMAKITCEVVAFPRRFGGIPGFGLIFPLNS